MRMKQCSETSAYKIRGRGIIQKKEYDSTCVFSDVVMNGAVWTHNVAVCKLSHVLESYKSWTMVCCGCCHYLLGLVPLSQHTAPHNFPEITYFPLQVKFCLQVSSPDDGNRWFPRRSLVLCAVTVEELAINLIGETSVCVYAECGTPGRHDFPFSS
jgi:hypothetical protein